jgi:hypothetical protein
MSKTPPGIEAAFLKEDYIRCRRPGRAVSSATRWERRDVDTKNSWMAWLQVDAPLSTVAAKAKTPRFADHPELPWTFCCNKTNKW